MSEVKVLVEGYAGKDGDEWSVTSTATLIKDSGLNVLVDPGANKEKLLQALAGEKVDLIFITHYHPDHILNIRLFPDTDVYEGDAIYRGDKIISYSGNIPNTNIQVIETQGHAHEHCALLVETNEGKVCVAGDNFWWRRDQEQKTDRESLLAHKDAFAKDWDKLVESRKKLLGLADVFIPGHGKMFKVEK